ncbi:bifunctional tetrahydrofolate synthase/dihydrofolate synthase [Marinomonas ostreistagni]|uniref:bifunctional tetrahydrofolate synthase/dihydrofolate synthase n=1 Tax=Marinomonas ostreistagni TaxID=359209 RepID=UPI001950AD6E|nr:bifunctional tetrahydrofolate synthase/dihydrofolate synthase [Marinomonas ostreistagni]MBM6550121.1 bifunctional tetrahydrofolate synthase/dihydrofolate synthase [Marinomonas ostreistagni]
MSARSLSDWLSYIESQHPSEIELGLERGLSVLEKLNLGRPKAKVITVAGTNGKGSTCTMLSQYLTASGYRVGTYTSPHFLRFNERVAIDGLECSDELLVEAFTVIEQVRGDTPLTYFEFSTLAALWVFDRLELDYWVLEVGLGGRLDSVNMVDTDLAVVTSIALDHIDWLGDSIDGIGREKAGIARPGKPLISGVVNPPQSIADVAQEVGSPLLQKHKDFTFSVAQDSWSWQGLGQQFDGLPIPKLPLENAATVIATLLQLDIAVTSERLTDLFREATLVGRFQQVATSPDVFIDVAHNPEAAIQLKQQLDRLGQPVIAVCGMLKDKDISAVMKTLKDSFQAWYLLDLDVPRGAKASELAGYLPEAHQYQDMRQALADACAEATKQNATVVVFGSFVTVSAYLSLQA